MSDLPPVGFIGLGNIGGPMALRLADWPAGLTVYDLDPAATARCAKRGASVAASPAEVAQALLVLATTIGFPAVAAGLKWSQKYLEE